MEPIAAAKATGMPILEIGGGFMLDGATYVRGGELGFSGIDFYVLGRGGVLGDTSSEVVTSEFIFWNSEQVRSQWETAKGVMSPAQAAAEWAACCAAYGEANLPDVADMNRVGDLLTTVVNYASPANASLFSGWRTLPVPQSPKARVQHQLNALRELRGALHGGAVLGVGLLPVEAVMHRTPHMAGLFGWDGDAVKVDDIAVSKWKEAEASTDVAMARVLSILSAEEREELATALGAMHQAWTAAKG